MSKALRTDLGITREEELAMPLGDWVDALSEPHRSALKARNEWQQRAYRSSPVLAFIMESVVFAPRDKTTAAPVPSTPCPAEAENAPDNPEPAGEDLSSSAEFSDVNIFGDDDDDW